MLSCLFIAALWSPAVKELTSWLLFVILNCVFVTFPFGILGQVWYLIVLIPDLCCLSNFYMFAFRNGMTDHTHSPSVFFHAMGLGDFNGLSNGWKMRTASTIKKELGHSEVNNK